MNAIKISLMNFKKNVFTYVLVLLEISVLLLTANYLVSVMKEHEMYIAPFRCALNENTAFVEDKNAMSNMMKNKTFLQSREELLSGITDDYKIYDVMSTSNGEYVVLSLTDELYRGLALPLFNGSYKSAVGTFGTKRGEHEIRFADGTSMKLNTSGTLTAITSIPEMNSVNNNMTANDFYYTSVSEPNIILTNRTSISGYEHQFEGCPIFFIEFEKNAAENFAKIESNGGTITAANMIAENSRKKLDSDISGTVPIVCLITFVSLLGIIFVSVITFKENERKTAVFRLCGYSVKMVVGIHCVGILFITILSTGVAALAFGIMKLFKIEAAVGLTLSPLNILVTLATIAAMIFAAVVPIFSTAKKKPIEYFRKVL